MADKKPLVLVVDDDPMLRELAEAALCEDFDVITAADGQEGWQMALANPPDLVITDLMMPNMHGYELCARLKGRGGVSGVKVIVASSKKFPADIAQAKSAGADAYVPKPYNTEDLRQKALELVGAPAVKEEAQAVQEEAPAAERPQAQPDPQPAADPAFYSAPEPGGGVRVGVRFWGTRGSCPTGGAKNAFYGGNTSCVEMRVGGQLMIIDCGTGIRELGESLAREFKDKPLNAHIFVGHTHWDHIQGFPFFAPLYNPRNSFRIYSVHGGGGSLRSVFHGAMAADYFPIPLTSLAAKVDFIEMSGPVDLGAAKVKQVHLNHPGACIGFRIEAGGKVVTCLSDHEGFARLSGDSDMARRQDEEIISFCRGSDLLIREAQYSEEEYRARRGWGHSTFDDAVSGALRSGVKRLVFTHHDPSHTDDDMARYEEYCRGLAAGRLECSAAREGLALEL